MRENALKYDLRKLFLNSLINGVKPALGCTEPVAVGIAVAKAYELIKGNIKKVNVLVSPNIYKNGMGVGIPGTGEIGLVFAAALGITCGNAELRLEVFKNVNHKAIEKAKELIDKGLVEVGLETKKGNFYIKANIMTDKGEGTCIIRNSHTNIVFLEANGQILLDKNVEENSGQKSNEYMKDINLVDIREFVENIPYEDIKFLLEGVKLNMNMAEVGLREKPGPGLGAAMELLSSEGVLQRDIVNKARMMTAAACDARMAGLNLPVMSSAGSGNHGITAIIPPALVCEDIGCDDEKLARTLAFSHLVTAYIKVFTGVLSPVCGCAVAAGVGASASIAWALGGNDEQIGAAVKNMVATLAGMICDGAKGGCAFKLSTASSEAIIQAKLALENIHVNDFDGIVNPSVDETIRSLGKVCTDGMKDTDNVILDIMSSK